MTATRAWPAAVAAGRRRDYSTVLAPDVLADGYGALVEALSPGPVGGPPRMRTLGGGRFTVAYVTHALTTADLGEAGREPLRDEQSRPLLMMYGLVRAGTTTTPPQQSDLDGAKRVALTAYRHFLAGEEAFRALASRAVPVDWPVAAAATTPAQDRKVGRAGVAAPTAAQDRNLGRADGAAATNAQARWLGRAGAAAALVVLVALVGWFFLRSGGETQPCAPATAVVVASPAPATCPPTTGQPGP